MCTHSVHFRSAWQIPAPGSHRLETSDGKMTSRRRLADLLILENKYQEFGHNSCDRFPCIHEG